MDTSKQQEILMSKANISILLEYLSQRVIDADAENISYYFDYNDFDLFNSFWYSTMYGVPMPSIAEH